MSAERFKTEAEILKAIDVKQMEVDDKLERAAEKARAAELLFQKAIKTTDEKERIRLLKRRGKLLGSARWWSGAAERVRNTNLKELKNKLAIYRTGLLPMSGLDPDKSIPK